MSESTGPHCVNSVVKGFQKSAAGKTTPGAITKIQNPDKDGNGEVDTSIIIPIHVYMCVRIFSMLFYR